MEEADARARDLMDGADYWTDTDPARVAGDPCAVGGQLAMRDVLSPCNPCFWIPVRVFG